MVRDSKHRDIDPPTACGKETLSDEPLSNGLTSVEDVIRDERHWNPVEEETEYGSLSNDPSDGA